jgi:hypothetical protein
MPWCINYANRVLKEIHATPTKNPGSPKMLDYGANALEMLESKASRPSKLAKDIAKIDGMADEPKLAVSKTLKVLQTEGLAARQVLSFKARRLCFITDALLLCQLCTNLWLIGYQKLEEKGIEYTLAKPGENKPDIMTKDFNVEIETGLKHDIRELEKRLAIIIKKTYVILPNNTEKLKYEAIIKTKSNNMTILTIAKSFSI